jgi:putative FmdB family regulatory protein
VPIYEFRCADCEAVFEALRPVGDSGADLRCPKCRSGSVEKIFSVFAAGSGSGGKTASSCGGGGFT